VAFECIRRKLHRFRGGKLFCGARLQVAREFRGLTQTQLGKRVAASCALISLCETGRKKDPALDLVEACGSVLGFSPAFFYSPIQDVFHDEECNFRHRLTTPERIKSQLRAHGTLIGLVIDTLRSRQLLPPINVPRIPASSSDEIEAAAQQCRQYWKLQVDTPLPELANLIEGKGVIIVRYLVKSKEVDTFSRYSSLMATIFPNQEIQNSSRCNFDVAHELGHLVIHRGVQTGTIETERAANKFAGAFLMPRQAFARDFQGAPFSLGYVLKIKSRWRISAEAVVRRAYDLKLLDAVEYRKALKQVSGKTWSKRETHEPGFHRSGLFEEVLNGLGQKATLTIDLPIEKLCQDLCFTPGTFSEVTGIANSSKNTVPRRGTETPSASPTTALSADQALVVATSVPEPCSEFVAHVPKPYGLDSVRPGAKELFLLRGYDNCELARHSGQHARAIGIETWHPGYMDEPPFKAAERVWVVINRSDDRQANDRFLQSIAADNSIRERCLIAAVQSVNEMIDRFKWVLQQERAQCFFASVFQDVF
jgi:Zn-dependent peptidase ImmA (M78 family)/DNA-binding XRE family transcriptional regulator